MFEYEFIPISTNEQLYSSHLSSSLDDFTIGTFIDLDRLYLRYRKIEISKNINISTTKKNTFSIMDDTINVNGTTFNVSTANSLGKENVDICIFNNPSKTRYSIDRFYTLKLYDNNKNLLRDYIPVLNKNDVAGLYDLVENKFYSSETETEFIAGNEI